MLRTDATGSQMAARLSASQTSHALHPRNMFISASGTHFCSRLSKYQGLELGKLLKIIHFIGSWTHNLPACSIVPRPLKPTGAPTSNYLTYLICHKTWIKAHVASLYSLLNLTTMNGNKANKQEDKTCYPAQIYLVNWTANYLAVLVRYPFGASG
jgi:hypothetical protein